MEEQVCVIYAGVNGYLDPLPLDRVRAFEDGLLGLLHNQHGDILKTIRESRDLDDAPRPSSKASSTITPKLSPERARIDRARMPSLKDLRNRIAATKATQKITKAMQMVAASKLRRAQAAAEAARPYASRMDTVLGNIAASVAGSKSRRGCCAAPAATNGISSLSAPPNADCAARSIPRSCGSPASAPMR